MHNRILVPCCAFSLVLLSTATTLHAQPAPFADAKAIHTLPWDADWVTAISFIGNDKVAAGNKIGDILVWNLPAPGGKTPAPARRLLGHTNEINRLITTPDGKTLISASNDRTVKYWDAVNDKGAVGSVVLNRREIETALDRKKKAPTPVEIKVAVQKATKELVGHKDWVLGLTQTPDGKTLVTGDDKGVIIVWDLPAGKELRRWQTKGWIWGLAVSPDAKTVVASERIPLIFDSGARTAFNMWDAETGKSRIDLSKDIKERMAAAAYSPDGKWLAVVRGGEAGGLAGKVTLLDPVTGKKLRETSPGHQDGATDLAFHPDGKHIFSAGRDTLVKVWQLTDGKHVRDLGTGRGGQFKDWICAIAISPDGRLLAAADMAGQVVIYALSK
ncbi:MAG: hypothetical protein EXS16_08075 [Gemmataceae bacterium]|nr:hypothetical protein [Gemmataceae bacterium]